MHAVTFFDGEGWSEGIVELTADDRVLLRETAVPQGLPRLDGVIVDDSDCADSRARQGGEHRAAEATCPNDEHACVPEPLLRCDAEPGQGDLTGVPGIHL